MAGRKPRLIALFDVDGTLTAARKDVTPGMLKFMSDLRKVSFAAEAFPCSHRSISEMRLVCTQPAHLQFRGQRIWSAAMEELMSQGTRYARQALLSGCSGGGLASILHCDEFGNLFHGNVKVKCLSDAGLFLDAVDVSGGRPLRKFFGGVVNVAVLKSLPYV